MFSRRRAALLALTFLISQLATGKDLGGVDDFGRPVPMSAGRTGFFPAAQTPQPFWYYALFGGYIGGSNIVLGPTPAGGGPREIVVGGWFRTVTYSEQNNFWQALKFNPASGNYDQVFVSPVYSAAISRLGIANVTGDATPEIVVMLLDGRVFLYNFATKAEIGHFETGFIDLQGLSLADLDNDGHAEIIITTSNHLYVYNGNGDLSWFVVGAGGNDVVIGQFDNDPALEIVTASGKVVDAGTHAVQWVNDGGFGDRLRVAPLPGQAYQQLIATDQTPRVAAYDLSQHQLRWSIPFSPSFITALEVADTDNNGIPEVIVGSGAIIRVFDLISQDEDWEIGDQVRPPNVAVGDVNGDGVPELVFGSAEPDRLVVARTTKGHGIAWQSTDLRENLLGPFIGDLDGDGQPELVIGSKKSASISNGGRIAVFDLATLRMRATSGPVADDRSVYGILDLKLRDVDGDGKQEIVVSTDHGYSGLTEIYRFDSANSFTRIWQNDLGPFEPFVSADVADLDKDGTPNVITAGTGFATNDAATLLYDYNFPAGDKSWQSPGLASASIPVNALSIDDLDGNSSKEIIALLGNGDLYTFDGPTRQIRSHWPATSFTSLGNVATPAGLVAGDNNGVGHFLQYSNNNYVESFVRSLGTGPLTGINVLANGALWTGSGGVLGLRQPPSYDHAVWLSPYFDNIGRFVATGVRNGQNAVFASTGNAIVGFTYTPTSSPTPVPSPTPDPMGTQPIATLLTPDNNGFVTFPQTFAWELTTYAGSRVFFSGQTNNAPGGEGTVGSTATFNGGGSVTISPDGYSEIRTFIGPSANLYWTVGSSNNAFPQFAPWRLFTTGPSTAAPTISPAKTSFKKKVKVTLTAAAGATIVYTLDGHSPNRSSPVYTGPLTFTQSTVIRTKAIQPGLNDSPINSQVFLKKRRK